MGQGRLEFVHPPSTRPSVCSLVLDGLHSAVCARWSLCVPPPFSSRVFCKLVVAKYSPSIVKVLIDIIERTHLRTPSCWAMDKTTDGIKRMGLGENKKSLGSRLSSILLYDSVQFLTRREMEIVKLTSYRWSGVVESVGTKPRFYFDELCIVSAPVTQS